VPRIDGSLSSHEIHTCALPVLFYFLHPFSLCGGGLLDHQVCAAAELCYSVQRLLRNRLTECSASCNSICTGVAANVEG
jgi:hypothetical protein